jgi:hypothetical protein
MNHYKVKLARRNGKIRRYMTLYFSMGLGLKGEPTAADVLDCLSSDASTIENASGFEDWANELGFDADSRKAERSYRVTERQTKNLQGFLGDDAYQQLLYHTERL